MMRSPSTSSSKKLSSTSAVSSVSSVSARYRRTAQRRMWGARYLAMSFCAAAVVSAALVGLVVVRNERTQLGYEVHALRARRTELDGEMRRLMVEHAALGRPERLAQRAREHLGLVPVEQTRIVVWSKQP